jgi:hypothetical protein
MKMKRTAIMLPSKLKARALLRANEQGISLGELIRTLLSQADAWNYSKLVHHEVEICGHARNA